MDSRSSTNCHKLLQVPRERRSAPGFQRRGRESKCSSCSKFWSDGRRWRNRRWKQCRRIWQWRSDHGGHGAKVTQPQTSDRHTELGCRWQRGGRRQYCHRATCHQLSHYCHYGTGLPIHDGA